MMMMILLKRPDGLRARRLIWGECLNFWYAKPILDFSHTLTTFIGRHHGLLFDQIHPIRHCLQNNVRTVAESPRWNAKFASLHALLLPHLKPRLSRRCLPRASHGSHCRCASILGPFQTFNLSLGQVQPCTSRRKSCHFGGEYLTSSPDYPPIVFQTEYHVCATCGMVGRCEHDDGPGDALVVPSADEAFFEMACVQPILLTSSPDDDESPHEIFNTYGGLSSAELLTQYGFVVDGNPYDTVTFAWDELLRAGHSCGYRFGSQPPMPGVELHADKLEHSSLIAPEHSQWSVNAEGLVSSSLWLVLFSAVFAHSEEHHNHDRLVTTEVIQDALRVQLAAEGGDINYTSPLHHALCGVARVIIQLCIQRRERLSRPRVAYSSDAEGDDGIEMDIGGSCQQTRIIQLLDTLPPRKPRTRLALSLVLGELSLVGACEAGWKDCLSVLDDH